MSDERSSEDPFNFFTSLIIRGGLRSIRRVFVNTSPERDHFSHRGKIYGDTYDSETDSVRLHRIDRETEEVYTESVTFRKHLSAKLNPPYFELIEKVESNFRNADSDEQIRQVFRYYRSRIGELQNELQSRYDEKDGREAVKNCLDLVLKRLTARKNALLNESDGSNGGASLHDGRIKHKMNKEWIKDKWEEVREQHPERTQVDIIEKIQTAYRKKFDRKPPSESTIREYNDKK